MATVVRFLAFLALILGLIALAADVIAWQQRGVFNLTTVGERWFEVHSTSLQQAQPLVQRYLLPVLWDPIFVEGVLLRPTVAVFAILAVTLFLISRLLHR